MAPINEEEASPSALGPLVAMLARGVLIVHAALLVAQPFIAGTMLDGRSAGAQAWHVNVGMALPTLGFVQIIVTLFAWRVSQWPQGAFTGSIALWLLELTQFFIGYLGMPLAMHVPLGVLLVIAGVSMAYFYGQRDPSPTQHPTPPAPPLGRPTDRLRPSMTQRKQEER